MAPFDAGAPSPVAPAPDLFREVLARLAGGVAIVACWDGDAPRGLLVSSITGLSVEPPRFLFCVRKAAGCHDAMARANRCSVALLSSEEEDEDEALRFAQSDRTAERFDPGRWGLSTAAAPVYRRGLASAFCRIDQVIDAETHSLFIVTADHAALQRGAPLVAWNRRLLRLQIG